MTDKKKATGGQPVAGQNATFAGAGSGSNHNTDGQGKQPGALLSRLWQGGSHGFYWTSEGRRSLWVDPDKLPPIPAQWSNQNVYFGVHPCIDIPPTNSKGEKTAKEFVRSQIDYIAAVNCFFAEFDAKDFEGGKPAILAHLDTFPQDKGWPYPSVIVDSGGGYHCYFLLEHTVTVNDENRAHLARVQAAWVGLVGGDNGAKDLSRVLRIPGTLNVKKQYAPNFPTVEIIEANFQRLFALKDFEELTEHLRSGPAPTVEETVTQRETKHVALDDEKLLERAKAVSNGANFERLWNGGTSDYNGDHSAADMALCCHLAFWTGRDAARMDRLFRASGLMRDKWDVVHYSDGSTYGEKTISRAIAQTSEVYTPKIYTNGTGGVPDEPPDWLGNDDSILVEGGQQILEDTTEADKERFTDLGNARRFARLHGHNFRYTRQWGWMAWTGQRWAKDETGLAMRASKRTATGFYTEAALLLDRAKQKSADAGADGLTDEQRAKLGNEANTLGQRAAAMNDWAKKCQARARLESIVKLAESELPIATKTDDFDSLPWTLNVENGIIDLSTGELHPHNRNDLLTTLAPVRYDPGATCPLWLSFLDRIMGGSAEMVDFLRRAIGYALTGDVSEQVLFFLWGGGSNGKSTFINTILSILGEDYAIQAAPELLVIGKDRHPTEVADLYGKRLVASIEVEDGRRLAEGLVKQLTGGDKLKARLMRQDFFQFDPTHKLFLVANHKPIVKGTDYAIWRRIKLIPFDVTIGDEEKDPQLPEKLKAEASGILAWAVRGCLEWQRQGLAVPDTVRDATEAYKTESDTLSSFLEECTVTVKNGEVQASELYKAYTVWCEDNGERAMNGTLFGRKLGARGFDKYTHTSTRRTFYLGIGLLNASSRE